jgi:hypothetical protein
LFSRLAYLWRYFVADYTLNQLLGCKPKSLVSKISTVAAALARAFVASKRDATRPTDDR